jgi:hypothetical protein
LRDVGRGGSSAGSARLPSSLQSVPMLASLLIDPNINSLAAPPKVGPSRERFTAAAALPRYSD